MINTIKKQKSLKYLTPKQIFFLTINSQIVYLLFLILKNIFQGMKSFNLKFLW